MNAADFQIKKVDLSSGFSSDAEGTSSGEEDPNPFFSLRRPLANEGNDAKKPVQSTFMRRIQFENSKKRATPAMPVTGGARDKVLEAVFDNQIELAAGRPCLLKMPARPPFRTQWALLCPSMRPKDKAAKPKKSIKEDEEKWAYFDGFDLYESLDAVSDASFTDLVKMPNAPYDELSEEPPLFVERKVYASPPARRVT
jgi:hypothetical protein